MYNIAIPSRGRANSITTTQLFPDATVFVPADEADEYRAVCKNVVVADIVGETASKKRNFILDYYKGQNVLMLDDDVVGFTRLERDQTVECSVVEFCELARGAFADLIAQGGVLWGVYPVDNPGFMRHAISRKSFIIGKVMGVVNSEGLRFDENVKAKEDIDFSAQAIKHCGFVLRYDNIAVVTNKDDARGGCNEYRNDAVRVEDAECVLQKHSDLLMVNPRRANEVLFKKLQYYGSPRWSGEILDCSMPMTFDTYSTCTYKCLYCFSFFQRIHSSKSYVDNVKYVNVDRVKRIFMGEIPSQFDQYIKERRVMQWGGLSEPFDPMDKKLGVSLELLRFFAEIGYPLSICTKAVWWLNDERYTKPLQKLANEGKLHLKFTIITADEAKSKAIERNTPTVAQRLEGIQKASALGCKNITLRLRPFIIGVSEDFEKLIPLAKKAGADSVSTEFMCVESRADERVKKRFKMISKTAGYDIETFYARNSRGAGYRRLNYSLKKKYMEEMERVCAEQGMRFYVSDAHHKEKCHSGSCCGLPCSMNYSRGQFTEAIVIAKSKGVVRWKDISNSAELFKGFAWGSAEGYNTGSAEKRAINYRLSMYDWMHEKWNNPNDAVSPYRYFEGVLYPVSRDENGDIVYQYNPERKKLQSSLK